MDYKALGKEIRTRRKQLYLTQERLAELTDISFAFVGHIERGTRKPSLETVIKIADALDCTIDELVGRHLDMPR